MAMKRCPVCGEKYSDTYKNCPFCEEDELWEEEEPRRQSKSRRASSHGTQYSLITPTLIVLILLMAALLVYLLYGDKIAQRFSGDADDTPNQGIITQEPTPGGASGTSGTDGEEDPDGGEDDGGENPGGEDSSGEDPGGETGASGNAGVMPEGPDSGSQGTSGGTGTASGGASGSDYASLSQLPSGLTLSNPDFTRSVSEGAYRLRVSGGSGTYTWVSENPSIATVDSSGNVTPVSAGTVHILVSDGSKKAVGIVRVSGGSASSGGGSTSSGGTASGSSGSNTLNREDMTISVGETFKLQLSGVTTSLTWSVANNAVATVGGDGTVTGISKGMTTVTVSWDGHSKSCIVRVK